MTIELEPVGVVCNLSCPYCYEHPMRDAGNFRHKTYSVEKMAIVTNTFTTYSAKGIREDLSNVITNIAPEETPFMSNIGKENISNTLYEWQTDTLAAAAANAQLEGDDVTSFDAVTATVRLQNYAQISRKTIILSNTEEVVNKAGRRSEVAYQIAKRSAELKRDQEFAMLNIVTGKQIGRAHV